MEIRKTDAIKTFLQQVTHPDLANLYNEEMEVQVNVAQDGGQGIEGEFKGVKWRGWSDGMTTWKPFRIPYKANTEPEYNLNSPIKFDMQAHAEGIGMTGWNWKKKVSQWVAFDFDAIVGHSDKHTKKVENDQLEAVKNAACTLPWVTVRRSTSGQGLHLYVFLPDVPTSNHNEHAALGRAILGLMSATTGFDFSTKVDICGGNMWVWHRKMIGTNGLSVLRHGHRLDQIPENWRDHINVVTGRQRKITPSFVERDQDIFEELCGQRQCIPLDSEHKRLIEWLQSNECRWWWDTDHHMLVTHTFHLKEAHAALQFRGTFKTKSMGSQSGSDHNCFLYPLRRGSWVVRRFSPGVQEEDTWSQDQSGWTRCYYNREPDFKTACRSNEGVEHPTHGFVFRHVALATQAALQLGVDLQVPTIYQNRECRMKEGKDGRIIVSFESDARDDKSALSGNWIIERDKYLKIFDYKRTDQVGSAETTQYDDIVRHIVTADHEDCGWAFKPMAAEWTFEPIRHVQLGLKGLGILKASELDAALGAAVNNYWTLVNKPFQPEYPGNRQWNRDAAQFAYAPSDEEEFELSYPTWTKILKHLGRNLDAAVRDHPWARANGIETGADYLKCWVASLFQSPLNPLPYLFFYGPQNCGKSIWHEAISLLVTRGVCRADNALISQAGFNGELKNAVLCVVEETDLRSNKNAYARIKDYVTSPTLSIHEKNRTPYSLPNSTHWIQCANEHSACPVFPGDTRITLIKVDLIDPIDLIPKGQMIELLKKEAGHFLGEILRLEIPKSTDRLGIPVVTTSEKSQIQAMNRSNLEIFLAEMCQYAPGEAVLYGEFCDAFFKWVEPTDAHNWTKRRIGASLPIEMPKGRYKGPHWYIGNVSFDLSERVFRNPRLILRPDMECLVHDTTTSAPESQ